VRGQQILDGYGNPLLLRGVGLGNWLLPEGYMWQFKSTRADRPRRIEAMISRLAGEEYAKSFWQRYRGQYIAEADIAEIARLGFNSVRVPINARWIWQEGTFDHYFPETLVLIDQMIAWCEAYGLYVILDLHGAPGGQTGANIDDSADDFPELYRDSRSREATIALWTMLATRYRDSKIVLGYDLLNEPLAPGFRDQFLYELEALYREITAAIRTVDDHHIIIVEGAVWATDWTTFTERYDDQLVLQFHKYWSPPDTNSIQSYLNKRQDLDVPIWMGEGGENHPSWIWTCFQLYEAHDIGWNFWPWKKMDTVNSPYSIRRPQAWKAVTEYVEQGTIPPRALAQAAFDEFLENIKFENNTYCPAIVDALFGRLDGSVEFPAVYFGHSGEGVSYHALEPNRHPFRTNDGPQIENVDASRMQLPRYHAAPEDDEQLVLVLRQDEWVQYRLVVEQTAILQVKATMESTIPGSTVAVTVNANPAVIVQSPDMVSTVALTAMPVNPGAVTITVSCTTGVVRLVTIHCALEEAKGLT
jgi:endoglucanase